MKVLQIANGFLSAPLYKKLFEALSVLKIENLVFVPVHQREEQLWTEQDGVFVCPCFSTLDRILFFSKQSKMLAAIEERIDLSAVDVIHAHTVFSGGYCAYQLHKRYGTPYIVAVRNTDVNAFFKWALPLRKTGVEVMKCAERIIFLSPEYRDTILNKRVPKALQESFFRKSMVIPNGISPLFLQHKAQPKKLQGEILRLIYIGEISSNKNLETTIQAVEILRKGGTSVLLTVVGAVLEEKYRPLLERTEWITYHDRCTQEEVLAYLNAADVFVMPSHTETFGLVYAEAMSQGLPVLYTRGQGFDGQFPDGVVGYAVSDRDPVDIANRIQQTIVRYAELSTNCIRCVDKFNWCSIADKYKDIYRVLVSSGD